MMASITHYWKRARLDLCALIVCALFGCLQPVDLHAQPVVAEVTQLDLNRSGDGVELAAAVTFQLPPAVEDALYKGLPLIFVEEAEVYRERWYWMDKRVGGAQRHMRLVYQPLIRRWRLTAGAGAVGGSQGGVALAQSFDTLEEALGVIRRVSGWRIAEFADLETGTRHRFEFRFRLDITQLPRPLQIGALGESDWVLALSASKRLQPETLK
ncbi:MAG: DUF4390 domain-containing protein [Hylemonella sp.]|nr:DUF4390 domain-containing protein [Hylemonella sp.]